MTKSKPPVIPGISRKHVARAEREAQLRQWILIGTAAVVALVVALFGYGWLDLNVIQPGQPVAKVGNKEISTRDFQMNVKNERYQLINQYIQIINIMQVFAGNPSADQYYQQQLAQIEYQLTDTATLGRDVLNRMINDEIIRQEAARRGITVSAEEVDKAIQEAFNYYADGTPTPFPTSTLPPTMPPTATFTPDPSATIAPSDTPTATALPTQAPTAGPSPTPMPTATAYTLEGFNVSYNEFLSSVGPLTGMTNADVRHAFETNLLRLKLIDALTVDLSHEITEAHARHILVSDQATALALIERLKGGEDWVTLAADFSQDESNKNNGGDLGLFTPGRMVAEFDSVVFSADLGVYPDAVQTQFGWHIIEILSRDVREMTAAEYATKQREVFDAWLNEQRANTDLIVEYAYWQLRVPSTPSVEQVLKQQQDKQATAQALTPTP